MIRVLSQPQPLQLNRSTDAGKHMITLSAVRARGRFLQRRILFESLVIFFDRTGEPAPPFLVSRQTLLVS